jgi:hypothetical protein
MKNIDPDILHALRSIAADGDTQRVERIKKTHDKQLDERIRTQMELLEDEVERVIPRSHQLFESVLLLTVLRKVARTQAEPEFRSFLDEGFPQGW